MAPLDAHRAIAREIETSGRTTGRFSRPSREDAESAVATLLAYLGEDPQREGLLDTPRRVVKSYEDFFGGYGEDPVEILSRTFSETAGYSEMIAVTDIAFVSHCEHHMVPIIGRAHVAYLPHRRVVGVSKLARVVELFAKRLQIQERLTAQVADTIQEVLQPRGVAVMIRSQHLCMTLRGVKQTNAAMVTSRMHGAFRSDPAVRQEFESLVRESRATG